MSANPLRHNTTLLFLTVLLLTAIGCRNEEKTEDDVEETFFRLIEFVACNSMEKVDSIINATKTTHTDSATHYIMEAATAMKHFYCNKPDSMFLSMNNVFRWLSNEEREKGRLSETLYRVKARMYATHSMYFMNIAGQVDSAITYNEKAYNIVMKEMRDATPADRLWALTNIADLYKQHKEYDKAISYYEEALEVLSTTGNRKAAAAVYMGIAIAYTALGDYTQSKVWWDKVKEMWNVLSPTDKFLYFNNRGTNYYEQKKYAECKACLVKALQTIKETGLGKWEEMFVKTNLADVSIKTGDYVTAKRLIPEADAFFKEVGFELPRHYLQTQRMEIELKEKIPSVREAEQLIAEDYGAPQLAELERMRLSVLIRKYAELNEGRKLLAAYQILDSINTKHHNNNLRMRLSSVVAANEHDKRLARQRMEIEEKNTQLIITVSLILSLIMMIVAITVITLLYRRKKMLEEDRLLHNILMLRLDIARNRITPHFFGNAMNNILTAGKEDIEKRLHSLARLIRYTHEQATYIATTLHEELTFINEYIDFVSNALQPNFRFETTIEEGIDPKNVMVPAMAIQIFVENAIKHGISHMAKDAEKRIKIEARKEENGIMVKVYNNGKKMKIQEMGNENTGLKIVRQTIQALNSQYASGIRFGVENEEATGCSSWLYIPNNDKQHERYGNKTDKSIYHR